MPIRRRPPTSPASSTSPTNCGRRSLRRGWSRARR